MAAAGTRNRRWVQWSPHEDGVYAVASSDIRLYRLAKTARETGPSLLGVSSADASSTLRCFDWCLSPEQPRLVAAGMQSGHLVLSRFPSSPSQAGASSQDYGRGRSLAGAGDAAGTIKEFAVKGVRSTNDVAWNPTYHNKVAQAVDRIRNDRVVVWDMSQSSSSGPDSHSTPIDGCALNEPTLSVAWVPSQPLLIATGAAYRWLKVYDLRSSGLVSYQVAAHNKGVAGIEFCPQNDHLLLSWTEGGTMKIWDLRQASDPLASVSVPGQQLLQAAWSPQRLGTVACVGRDVAGVLLVDLQISQTVSTPLSPSPSSTPPPVVVTVKRSLASLDPSDLIGPNGEPLLDPDDLLDLKVYDVEEPVAVAAAGAGASAGGGRGAGEDAREQAKAGRYVTVSRGRPFRTYPSDGQVSSVAWHSFDRDSLHLLSVTASGHVEDRILRSAPPFCWGPRGDILGGEHTPKVVFESMEGQLAPPGEPRENYDSASIDSPRSSGHGRSSGHNSGPDSLADITSLMHWRTVQGYGLDMTHNVELFDAEGEGADEELLTLWQWVHGMFALPPGLSDGSAVGVRALGQPPSGPGALMTGGAAGGAGPGGGAFSPVAGGVGGFGATRSPQRTKQQQQLAQWGGASPASKQHLQRQLTDKSSQLGSASGAGGAASVGGVSGGSGEGAPQSSAVNLLGINFLLFDQRSRKLNSTQQTINANVPAHGGGNSTVASGGGRSTSSASLFAGSSSSGAPARAALSGDRGLGSKVLQYVLHSSPQRKKALQVIQFPYDGPRASVAAALKQLEQAGQYEEAAFIALYHLDLSHAISLLSAGDDGSNQLRLVAMALSGFTEKGVNSTWDALCAALVPQFQSPFVRGIFAFLAEEPNSVTFHRRLETLSLPLRVRLAFTLRFLSDEDLLPLLQEWASALTQAGDLSAILLTGLSRQGVPVLQKYIDRTGDVQTAALAMSLVVPRSFKDATVATWVHTYCALLNQWRLWTERALFDVARGPLQPPKQVYARCNFCQRTLGLAMMVGDLRTANANVTQTKTKLNACPACSKPLPRCSVCLLHLGATPPTPRIVRAFQQPGGLRSGVPGSRFDRWWTWCQACHHGGHTEHLYDWFRHHEVCPVSDCPCCCRAHDGHLEASKAGGK